MRNFALASACAFGAVFLGSATVPSQPQASIDPTPAFFARSDLKLTPDAAARRLDFGISDGPLSLSWSTRLEPPPPPPPPTPQEALKKGILIVVSLASQQAFVFKNGELWADTPVSTGKEGNETPAGIFPILQKKVHHRSTLYDDAPMPFMQRLTWDGVALHAGRIPGYPASHGCIRLPTEFAKKLYGVTGFSSTIVVVSDEPAVSAKEARALV